MDNNIEQIILNKKYEELDSNELSYISEYISSADEYNSIRKILLMIRSAKEEELIPDISVKNNLLKKFQQREYLHIVSPSEKNNIKTRRFVYRFAYAALIAAGLFIAFILIRNSGKKEQTIADKQNQVEQKSLPDQKITSSDSCKQNQENKISIENNLAQTVNKQANISNADTTNNIILAQNNNQIKNTTKKGRTLNDDMALADIMYVAL